MYYILALILGLLFGLALAGLYLYLQKRRERELRVSAEKEAEEILKHAKEKAEVILLSAEEKSKEIILRGEKEALDRLKKADEEIKSELQKHKNELEKNFQQKLKDLNQKEERLLQKEEHLARKETEFTKREELLEKKLSEIENLKNQLENQRIELKEALNRAKEELERISGLSEKEAREIILKKIEEEMVEEKARVIMKIENEIREESKKKAQEIIAYATAKAAIPFVTEKTVSVVQLPSEEMKGRIIGREGRNIRTFEALTGVDLLIDDTPEVVVLSSHDPYRREIARISLERLIADGRIHPTRIEEVVKQVEEEMEQHLLEVGEKTCFELGIYGIHQELIKLLGKLKFRTSYSQNVLQHSIETAIMCAALAGELGLDPKRAKRAALLHDIGKAASYEQEGPHALIGAELARKYGEDEDIVNAIASHHEDIPITTILGILLQVSDALSGARPGARRELLEAYLKRIRELENLASSFEGVEKAYAIQAGREVRIIVDSRVVSDERAYLLAKEIAQKIEKELTYPGIIKVTVMRETRAIEYAK
ncbi:ribonuclease [Caldimicrobium thiodismutans]|jgi:ribonuclease Y|uniref:Ribonuclease Y n=1 Tax=Caldimicrobium thiodismutans TaxID=1653476 RepID=A0A0U5AP27_9BACT|nr:ribonuclease Y [Caldimicrobium thiodismutans]BAU23844.1 ribonuclease [Caldimicrobium thiodismutans]